jgi:hypothetical protein
MFDDIFIVRKSASDTGVDTIKVPLSYAPKRKYMERLLENPDLRDDTKVAIKLPRMSFEITSIEYDAERQLQKVNNINRAGSSPNQRTKFYSPIPYNLNFQLNIYTKSQDDALQVVEQIIPYFTPQYTLTIRPLIEYPTITEDIPLTILGVSFSDDYEGALAARRTIIYTIDFQMKINMYGPTGEGKIIRQADVDLYLIEPDSDVYTGTVRVVPNPLNVGPDSDYGFTTIILSALDSA